jgi:hypothetical protein
VRSYHPSSHSYVGLESAALVSLDVPCFEVEEVGLSSWRTRAVLFSWGFLVGRIPTLFNDMAVVVRRRYDFTPSNVCSILLVVDTRVLNMKPSSVIVYLSKKHQAGCKLLEDSAIGYARNKKNMVVLQKIYHQLSAVAALGCCFLGC